MAVLIVLPVLVTDSVQFSYLLIEFVSYKWKDRAVIAGQE